MRPNTDNYCRTNERNKTFRQRCVVLRTRTRPARGNPNPRVIFRFAVVLPVSHVLRVGLFVAALVFDVPAAFDLALARTRLARPFLAFRDLREHRTESIRTDLNRTEPNRTDLNRFEPI